MTSDSSDATRITTLPSGLRVVSEAMPRIETACVGLWVDVGARFEAADENGVAHMLEHMAFKGTTSRNARGIAEAIESVGGSLNAYTSREHTAFYARLLAPDLPLAVDILADILQRSTFDEAELDKERQVVLQEIGQVQDTPDDLVFDLFQEAAFPDQPLGRSILGPESIVESMPRAAIQGYLDKHYAPSRMVLAAAGKVDHDALVELAARHLTQLPGEAADAPAPGRYGGASRLEHRDDLEQAHVVIGLPAWGYHDPDQFALSVFSTAWGGGMSSRLFQEVRENRGLCYSVFSFASPYAETGLAGIYAGTGPEQLDELFAVVAAETAKFVAEPTEAEIARARAQLKAGTLMALEGAYATTDDLARQLLIYGRRMSTAEIIAKIDAVDLDAIRRVGRRLFGNGATPTVVGIGPMERLPETELHKVGM